MRLSRSAVRVAVYGGAFNPPHIGHAMVASWIRWSGHADRVVFCPTAAHCFGKQMTPFAHRLDACRALVNTLGAEFFVSAIESELPAPNLTINLMRALARLNPHDSFRFVMGADNLAVADKWEGFDDIMTEFNPIFVNREGTPPVHELRAGLPLTPMFPNISSTEVRERLRNKQPVSHMLTVEVENFLRTNSTLWIV